MENYSYISLLTNDNYIYGIILLAESLKQVKSKYPLKVLITKDVSKASQEILKQLNISYKLIDIIPMPTKLYEENREINKEFTHTWKNCFTKFKIFDLTEYKKIIFLDSDILILKNIDHLFNCSHMTACIDGEYFNIWPEYLHFNAGCLVIEPSHKLYLNLLEYIDKIDHKKYGRQEVIADQEILNFYFKDWPNKQQLHLNKYYNIFAPYIQEEQVEDIEKNAYFIHFIGRKPWKYFIKSTNETYSEYFYTKARELIGSVGRNLQWDKIINNITLSVYAICKNEKDNIKKWLECFSKADYVCILDTGSTDGSWELLQESQKKYSNLIIDQKIITPWRFDTARNLSLELVPKNTDIFFMVDLDETIKEDDWVSKVKNNWEPNFSRGVYSYHRNVDENDNILRTINEFRIHSKEWHKYINIVHEALVDENDNKMFLLQTCTPIPIAVWHYPKENKKTNYLELCEQDLELYPDDAIMRLQLCIECEIEEQFDKAKQHYQHLLNYDQNKIQWFEIARCYTGLGYICYKENKIDLALNYFSEGRILYPLFSDNYLLAMEIYFNNQQYDTVINLGLEALKQCYKSTWCNITDIKSYTIYQLLGLSYYYKKEYFQALNYFGIAKQLNPTKEFNDIYNEIFKIYYKTIGEK